MSEENNNEKATFDLNPKNNLGFDERKCMWHVYGKPKQPMPRLDYATMKVKMSNGCEIEQYIIPAEDKQKVLEALYPFIGMPSLDETMIDLHTGKKFKVRDYHVVREGDGNWIVTPYYTEAGGTLLDWKPLNDIESRGLDGDEMTGSPNGSFVIVKTIKTNDVNKNREEGNDNEQQ